jgi:hypothetical protein
VIEKEKLNFKELEHAKIEKAGTFSGHALGAFSDPNRKTSRDLCFIAFSSREPVSTSLENALMVGSGFGPVFLDGTALWHGGIWSLPKRTRL